MQILESRPVKEKIFSRLQNEALQFCQKIGRTPKLAVVLVGGDPASELYVSNKVNASRHLGFESEVYRFAETATSAEVYKKIHALNLDPFVDGILIQRPLPLTFREDAVSSWVLPEKDVDCFHPENVGRLALGLPGLHPCTPKGVLTLLDHYKISVSGRLACVVGRSSIVGKPMGMMLLSQDATLIQAHSKTQNLAALTLQADIIIMAAGRPGLLRGDMVKPGAVVIDVGIHRIGERIIGDVDFDSVSKVAGALSPVPGGVGPMTIAMLMENTFQAACAREKF